MSYQPQYPPQPRQGSNKQGFAIAALVIGIINLCAWFLPICGLPLAIIGIVLGIVGLPSSQKGMAIAGIVLSSLGLVAAIVNAITGALLATNYLNH